MKIIPFWRLQTNKQIGIYIGFTVTRFDYLDFEETKPFYQLQLDLLFVRILIDNNKYKSRQCNGNTLPALLTAF